MAKRGPVPKRSTQRRRRNKPAAPVTKAPAGGGSAAIPEPDKDWHPVALRWYEALAASGQARFFEPSDWATAYIVAESMSRDLKPKVVGTHEGEPVYASQPISGASLSSYLKAMTGLMVTEGDRRRVRLELTRTGGDEAKPTDPAADAAEEYRRLAADASAG